jgi:hypothetical protein
MVLVSQYVHFLAPQVVEWCQIAVISESGLFIAQRIRFIYAESGEPTSGLELLTCSLRVSCSRAGKATRVASPRS